MDDEVRALAYRDEAAEETVAFYEIDDIVTPPLQEQLTALPQVDTSLADLLVDEYRNLRTVTWATTSDVAYLENTYDLDAHQLRESLLEHGLARNEHSDHAGPLMFPERRKDELRPGMQNIDVDSLPYDVDLDDEADDTQQASLYPDDEGN